MVDLFLLMFESYLYSKLNVENGLHKQMLNLPYSL